tara:strand:+ start:2883 stop:4673 length:1791 start_codon:yes stop_codon:yes gene_type:complete
MTQDPRSEGLGIIAELTTLPDASPRDLTNEQLGRLRTVFCDRQIGLFLFAKIIFGYNDLIESLHLPICQLLGRWGESVLEDGKTITHPPTELDGDVVESHRRILIQIPRECFKTSLCTRANSLWQITHNPDITIGLFNEKAANAEAWCASIAQVVERSVLFQALWRDLIPKGIGFWDKDRGVTRSRNSKWGGSGLLFERPSYGIPELSLEPHGIGGATTGKHYTHKILDDIIGRNAAYSPSEMQNAVDWVDTSRPLERPAENGCELIVCTPWGYHDVYSHMLKKWKDEYVVMRRHILEDSEGNPDHKNGTSIFPTKISTKKAKQLLRVDPFINMAQYQCMPRPGRSQSFSDKWLRYGVMGGTEKTPYFRIRMENYDPEIFDPDSNSESAPQLVSLNMMDKAVILDPAPTRQSEIRQEPKAGNGIVVVAKDPWGRRYCLEAMSVQQGPTDILHTLMALCDKWMVQKIGIEEVNFSAVYAPLFQNIIRHEYDWEPDFFPCFTKGQEKKARIKQNLIPLFENGFFYFNEVGTATLYKEITEFPHGETVDIIDALSYVDRAVDRPESPEEAETTSLMIRSLESNMGSTGYGQFTEETPNG